MFGRFTLKIHFSLHSDISGIIISRPMAPPGSVVMTIGGINANRRAKREIKTVKNVLSLTKVRERGGAKGGGR